MLSAVRLRWAISGWPGLAGGLAACRRARHRPQNAEAPKRCDAAGPGEADHGRQGQSPERCRKVAASRVLDVALSKLAPKLLKEPRFAHRPMLAQVVHVFAECGQVWHELGKSWPMLRRFQNSSKLAQS